MKDYERIARTQLPRRSWTVMRIDGKAFHSWTRGLERPFSQDLADAMDETARDLCSEISGTVMGYVQSDEISLILTDFGKLNTQAWFDGAVQKMTSVSASLATARFNTHITGRSSALFDSRVFTVPSVEEAANYLIWRQRDAVRNSISMAAQSIFSHRALHGVTTSGMQDLMHAQGVNWNDFSTRFKRGGQVVKCSGVRQFSYVDKRTGNVCEAEADRSWWEIQPADHFTFERACELLAPTLVAA